MSFWAGVWRFLSLLIWGGLALFFIDFAIGNRAPVIVLLRSFRFMVEMPVYGVFFAGILCGVLLAGFATSWWRLQAYFRQKSLMRQTARLEKNLQQAEESLYSHEEHMMRANS